MAAKSDWLEAEIIKHIFRTGSFTKPTVLAICLCDAAPVDSDTGALTSKEIADAGSYARQDLPPLDANWSAPGAAGLTDNLAAITFPTATVSWGTITHIAICDSTTHGAGNLLYHGALSASKTVGIGDTFKFNIGDLDVSEA